MKAIRKTKLITVAFAAMLMTGISKPAFSLPHEPIELRSIGSRHNCPLFELKINNSETNQFFVSVKDEAGTVLFSEVVKGKEITRRYQVGAEQSELEEGLNVKFVVENIATHETFVYNISRKSRLVDEIVVARL